MIVICEECGKKYRIDPSKIRGAAARFKCRVCTHMIMVSKPQDIPVADSAVDLSVTEAATEPADSGTPPAGTEIKLDRSADEPMPVKPARKAGPGDQRSAEISTSSPMRAQPRTLTASVAKGKPATGPPATAKLMAARASAPQAPPIATASRTLIKYHFL